MAGEIKCYLCGEPINLGKMEYSIVELNGEIKGGYNYVMSDSEVLAYICSKCWDKVQNIKGGYLGI